MTDGVGQNVTLGGTGTLSLDAGTINGFGGMGLLVDNVSAYSLTMTAPLAITADQTWRNRSGNLLTIRAVDISTKALTVDGWGNTAITEPLTGGGTLTKDGTGTLTLSGANTIGGTITVAGGALNIRTADALGSATGGTSVLAGAALQLQGGIVFNPETLALAGSGTSGTGALRNMSGNNSYTGAITLDAASTIGPDADLLTITGTIATSGHAATFTGAGSTHVTGVVSGTGSVTKNADGTLILSGANTYSGTTTVNAGVLSVRHSSGLGATTAGTTVSNGAEIQMQRGIAVGAEALTLNGSGSSGSGALRNMSGNNSWADNITLGSDSVIESLLRQLTLSGTLSNGGNGADFYFGGAGNTLVSGTITNDADVVKSGTGTLTLQGANTYTGATIVNGGTLLVTGSLNGSAGTALTFGGSGLFNSNEAAGRTQGMGVLTFNAGDGNVQSTYGGSGNTILSFSALAPRGAGATGNFIVSGGLNGTTNKITVAGLPTGFIDINVFFNGAGYAYVDPAGYIREIQYGTDPGTIVSTGGVSVSGDHALVKGHITSQGTQRFETLHLSSNVNFNLGGSQKVTVGGILKTGNVAGGATITGGEYLTFDFDRGMTIRTDKENDSLSIHSPIVANGTNAVTKTGAGTLTLFGANTYTGGTYVNAGTLEIGTNERLLNSGSLTIAGGTFSLKSHTETVGSVVLVSGSISGTGSGTLIGSSYDVRSGSASAILAGSAALSKSTDGTVTLTGANTYTGATTISDGTLVAASTTGGALGGTTSVTVNSDATLALGASNQINNAAAVNLAGGTLSTGGFSEGTSSLTGAGTLSLTADGSHIDFDVGNTGTLAFAIFNPGSFSLTIDNWTGTAGVIGTASTDRLIFAADPTSSLANFIFSGYEAGAVALLLDGGFYEVTPNFTPVPEINPAFVASMLCAGVGIAFHRRAVRAKKKQADSLK